jgi:DNA-binding GntR family transcriptional regulator
VVRQTLGQQIANELRRDILYGVLPAGTVLAQRELCERFATSRMPVRDALKELMHEGLVVATGTNRVHVAPLSAQDLRDVFLIEGILHGIACRRLAEQSDRAAALEVLGALHQRMLEATERNALEELAELNWRFHREINSVGGSWTLRSAMKTVVAFTPRDFVVGFPQWIERSNSEHAELLAAMADGSGATAETIARRHVRQAGRDHISDFERRVAERAAAAAAS